MKIWKAGHQDPTTGWENDWSKVFLMFSSPNVPLRLFSLYRSQYWAHVGSVIEKVITTRPQNWPIELQGPQTKDTIHPFKSLEMNEEFSKLKKKTFVINATEGESGALSWKFIGNRLWKANPQKSPRINNGSRFRFGFYDFHPSSEAAASSVLLFFEPTACARNGQRIVCRNEFLGRGKKLTHHSKNISKTGNCLPGGRKCLIYHQ